LIWKLIQDNLTFEKIKEEAVEETEVHNNGTYAFFETLISHWLQLWAKPHLWTYLNIADWLPAFMAKPITTAARK
jgi:hypothetical protein